MACFPRIDTPCPLGSTERETMGSHCDVCDHVVLSLDGMDDGARRALLAGCEGPVCVSYKTGRRRATAFGVVMAAGLAAGSAMAGDVTAASPADDVLDTIVFVGGILDAADASWVDDSELQEVPVVDEPRLTRNTPAILLKDPEPRR